MRVCLADRTDGPSKRVEAKLKDLTERLDATRMELVKLSTEEQAKAQQAQAA